MEKWCEAGKKACRVNQCEIVGKGPTWEENIHGGFVPEQRGVLRLRDVKLGCFAKQF